jgi:hypothetical protein
MLNKNKFAGLSDIQRLKKLAVMSDDEIGYSDIPDMSNTKGWKRLYPDADENTIITDEMMFKASSSDLRDIKLEELANERIDKKYDKAIEANIDDLTNESLI